LSERVKVLIVVGLFFVSQIGFAMYTMGNRLVSSNTISGLTNALAYTVNSLNQYLQIENRQSAIENCQYDLNGNLTGEASNVRTNTYTWDIENQLVGFRKQEGTNVILAKYSYDVFGRRLSKVVNGTTNYYLYADEGLIGEFDAFGNNICSYGYAPDALWMNNPVFLKQPSTTGLPVYYYYLNDHLGAPQKLVAKNGSVVWSASISAFGETFVSPSSIITNNLRISSQYFDAESGQHDNTHRSYTPFNGRYISKDPIGEQGGFNLVCFVKNNPILSQDVLGLNNPGCDLPPGILGYLEGNRDCYLRCCAQHDSCFYKHRCTQWSFGLNIIQTGSRCSILLYLTGLHPCVTCQAKAWSRGIFRDTLCRAA